MAITFYEETIEIIEKYKYSIYDIDFCFIELDGKEIQFDFLTFKNSSNFIYNNGYGSQEINPTIKIIFKNGDRLERREYDGAEWWELVKFIKKDKQNIHKNENINFLYDE